MFTSYYHDQLYKMMTTENSDYARKSGVADPNYSFICKAWANCTAPSLVHPLNQQRQKSNIATDSSF